MIAIITARGGSKRIPKKNIIDFFGKPLISYSIIASIESQLFDKVMISTDNDEIKEVAIKYGAEVPFMRSEKNSDDFSTTRDVILEVINEYKKNGYVFSEFACIYPTAPFITKNVLVDAYNKFKNENANALMPVVRFSFPPQRGVVVENGKLTPVDNVAIKKRSQDLKSMYHDVGQFYFYKTKEFLESTDVIIKNTIPYEIDERFVQDIDTMEDLNLAKMKYELFMKKNKN